ncbi:hypothetical protein PCS91_21130 [Escherichia coli]|uniref:hypothetical protein n=1 Tax=Escherichia coli TaxID=562 RepID=UPI002815A0E3|nr:hypothetical protein [Escherichia coli]WMO85092.1 hypothetical protein PCS91_21130 [Escherichia coli]HEI2760491.1 hypothetical protein [Escherichia coli]
MSILLVHQLSPTALTALRKARLTRIAKAELALIRVQSLLGLSDEELLHAARRVTAPDAIGAPPEPPKQP